LEWPLDSLNIEKLILETSLTYLFFCQRGKRSGKLVHMLRSLGRKNVFSLADGVEAMATVAKDSIKV
jgi:rhodanese-related sulfurtransferase